MVNDILGDFTLNDFLKSATRDQTLELRASASVGLNAEKKMPITNGRAANQKYIGFLSAVIQECDRRLAAIKAQNAKGRKDYSLLLDEYKTFRKLTREIAGRKIYDQIIGQIKQQTG